MQVRFEKFKIGLDENLINQSKEKIKKDLEEYLAGKKFEFNYKINLSSFTEFEQKVWNEMRKIPYGKTSSWFQQQFIGRISDGLAVDKDGGQITSVTGATISSRAVANSIKNGLETLTKQLAGSTTENE